MQSAVQNNIAMIITITGVSAGNNTVLILGRMSIAAIRVQAENYGIQFNSTEDNNEDLQVSAKGLTPIGMVSSQLEWKMETVVFYDMGLGSKG